MRKLGSYVALIIIGLFGLAAPRAEAQIDGPWTFPFGETRLEVDNRANVNGLTPPFIYTTVQPNDASTLSFYGTFRNLVWEGNWYHYGGRPPAGAAFQACARPHGHRGRRETLVYGTFRVTFNAAENRFEGVMTRCRAQVGASGYSQAFVGTRNNTYTQQGGPGAEPESRDLPFLPFNPAPPPPATPEQEAQRTEAATERGCLALRNELSISWSPDFGTHPCVYNIGDEIEIITRTDQSQRPVSVIYRAFHAGRTGRPQYLRLESRRGLPQQGVPRAGHRYRVSFGGDICRESTWMLSLLMSDGTETLPIGMIQTGDEQVALFRRGCNPGSHVHPIEDFVEPDVTEGRLGSVPRG